ncbi:hypothetical protein FHX75_111318 [Micromonospora palomenae]|uniref:Uncharacterized protein n=1 Tax=Micromonospora palomenae TaxID=1461247 RepID=A0A561WWC7_9ACTN|nr:hypothetical protein FHX75_111318 [Micromonospora palomenae]
MLIPLILLTAEAYTTRFGDKHQPLHAVFVAIPVVLYFGLIAAVQTMVYRGHQERMVRVPGYGRRMVHVPGLRQRQRIMMAELTGVAGRYGHGTTGMRPGTRPSPRFAR